MTKKKKNQLVQEMIIIIKGSLEKEMRLVGL